MWIHRASCRNISSFIAFILIDVKSESSMEKSVNNESKFPWLCDLFLWCHYVLLRTEYSCTPNADFVNRGNSSTGLHSDFTTVDIDICRQSACKHFYLLIVLLCREKSELTFLYWCEISLKHSYACWFIFNSDPLCVNLCRWSLLVCSTFDFQLLHAMHVLSVSEILALNHDWS